MEEFDNMLQRGELRSLWSYACGKKDDFICMNHIDPLTLQSTPQQTSNCYFNQLIRFNCSYFAILL